MDERMKIVADALIDAAEEDMRSFDDEGRIAITALEAAGFYVGRLEQVGWWDEDGFWRKGTGGPVPLTVEPVFRKVVSGDANIGCDKRCSEMHTYEPPCELAPENSGEPDGECDCGAGCVRCDPAFLPAGEVGDAD